LGWYVAVDVGQDFALELELSDLEEVYGPAIPVQTRGLALVDVLKRKKIKEEGDDFHDFWQIFVNFSLF
jgi:hypothetical protein